MSEGSKKKRSSQNPVLDACRMGSLEEAVEAIKKHSNKVRVAGYGENTPLHEAAVRGHAEICRALLVAGADPTVLNDKGDTPAGAAYRNDHVILSKWLDREMVAYVSRQKNFCSCLSKATIAEAPYEYDVYLQNWRPRPRKIHRSHSRSEGFSSQSGSGLSMSGSMAGGGLRRGRSSLSASLSRSGSFSGESLSASGGAADGGGGRVTIHGRRQLRHPLVKGRQGPSTSSPRPLTKGDTLTASTDDLVDSPPRSDEGGGGGRWSEADEGGGEGDSEDGGGGGGGQASWDDEVEVEASEEDNALSSGDEGSVELRVVRKRKGG